jgi:hypothetical protein
MARCVAAGPGRGGGIAPSFLATVRNVVSQEGPLALYTGLSAGLFRQATYTTTRLGVYNSLFQHLA